MNLIPVSVTADGDIVTRAGQKMAIPASQVPARARNKEIILGFRPEHVELGQPGIPMTIEMIEVLGSEKLIHGRVGDTLVVVRCDVHDTASSHDKIGDTIHAGADARHHLHWFDPQTTRRID